MTKHKIEVTPYSHGIYDGWNPDSKTLPELLKSTIKIPAREGIEFGFIIIIEGARDKELNYCIDHPGIKNSQGQTLKAFEGTVQVPNNQWRFFLGDTIWLPLDDKLGTWTLSCSIDSKELARKKFEIYLEDDQG